MILIILEGFQHKGAVLIVDGVGAASTQLGLPVNGPASVVCFTIYLALLKIDVSVLGKIHSRDCLVNNGVVPGASSFAMAWLGNTFQL